MATLPTGDWVPRAGSIERCRVLARQLIAGRITFEEYASNATLAIVAGPDGDVPACLESIPPEFADSYAEYLRAELEPVDFMPSPMAFVVDSSVPGVIERLKRQLRPRYLR